MAHEVRISGIVDESIVDGPGIRFVLFAQGCPHHCKGCHNPETHSYNGGYFISTEEVIKEVVDNPLLAGITFSGGEPFEQPKPLIDIAREVRKIGKNVITYSGYTFEQLLEKCNSEPCIAELLDLTDLLIDGRYIESFRNLELSYCGSSNQRILDKISRKVLLKNYIQQPVKDKVILKY